MDKEEGSEELDRDTANISKGKKEGEVLLDIHKLEEEQEAFKEEGNLLLASNALHNVEEDYPLKEHPG